MPPLDNLIIYILSSSLTLIFLLLVHKSSLFYFFKCIWISGLDKLHAHQFFKVPQFNQNGQDNPLYHKLWTYLNSLPSLQDSNYTNLFSQSNKIILSLHPNQTLTDTFLGRRLTWTNHIHPQNHAASFVLKIRRLDRPNILLPYLKHIHSISEDPKFYVIQNGRWRSIRHDNHATIDTVVLDTELKDRVKSDLETFLKSKHYYHRLGRVWMRTYSLHGPSGLDKSNFISAMARILSYDIYMLSEYVDLRLPFLEIKSRSLVVICDKRPDLNLELIAGDQMVIVFLTEGHDEFNLDRKIDFIVNFGACDFTGFKLMASSHLGVTEHKLFQRVEDILQAGSLMTPAEIGDIMISNRNSPSRAIKLVISALESYVKEGETSGGDSGGSRCESGHEWRDMAGKPTGAICKEGIHVFKEIRKLFHLKSVPKKEHLELVAART